MSRAPRAPRVKTVIGWSVEGLTPVFAYGFRNMTLRYPDGERDVRLGGELATRIWTDIAKCAAQARPRMLRSAAARLRAQIAQVNDSKAHRAGNVAEWEFAAIQLDAKANCEEFGMSGKRACNYPAWWQQQREQRS